MEKKTILITGCSSGIGYDVAHTLSKKGWRVFATCRSEIDCDRLRNEGLESFILDYSSEESIQAAVDETLVPPMSSVVKDTSPATVTRPSANVIRSVSSV